MALTLAQQLVEAEAAYHALMTGESAVEIRDSNGESVRYSAVNASRLKNYILDLKANIAAEAAGSSVKQYPMRMQF